MFRKFTLLFSVAVGLSLSLSQAALAHCPLCTVGAGAVALGALWLGITSFSVGIFLGAFAIALGLWIGRLLKKQYVPCQTLMIGFISFVTTILPLEPLLYDNTAFFVSFTGDYGTWLNTTYVIDKFLIGSVIGAIIVFLSPKISMFISKARSNKMIHYQGMIVTFSLLLLVSLFYEIFLK